MTYSVFNLTKHTQLSIRGTTGSHPDSEFVFGCFMDSSCFEDEPGGSMFSKPEYAYDDVDWEKAVEMAKWILEWDETFRNTSNKGMNIMKFKHVHLKSDTDERKE